MNISDWGHKDHYTPLPDDWLVVIADVAGSTQAIEQGRYKEVNVLGASCVIAVCNAIGEKNTHFVFGGDGAVLVVAPVHLPKVSAALLALAQHAKLTFLLDLRLGAVSVAELRQLGADVLTASERLPGGFSMSIFSGGGVALADDLIKQNPKRYALSVTESTDVLLTGLECRWNDIPSTRGKIMALLIRFRGAEPRIFQEVLGSIEAILPAASPVRKSNLPLTWPPKHLWTELRAKIPRLLPRLVRYVGIFVWTGLASVFVKRNGFDTATTSGRYCASIIDNTDHLKYDDVFRAVLDVTHLEAQAIEALLREKSAAGVLDYGIHFSEHALMTCFVRSLEHHMHFVDASTGGYAMAARQLKRSR